jgi:hypothetical protein
MVAPKEIFELGRVWSVRPGKSQPAWFLSGQWALPWREGVGSGSSRSPLHRYNHNTTTSPLHYCFSPLPQPIPLDPLELLSPITSQLLLYQRDFIRHHA